MDFIKEKYLVVALFILGIGVGVGVFSFQWPAIRPSVVQQTAQWNASDWVSQSGTEESPVEQILGEGVYQEQANRAAQEYQSRLYLSPHDYYEFDTSYTWNVQETDRQDAYGLHETAIFVSDEFSYQVSVTVIDRVSAIETPDVIKEYDLLRDAATLATSDAPVSLFGKHGVAADVVQGRSGVQYLSGPLSDGSIQRTTWVRHQQRDYFLSVLFSQSGEREEMDRIHATVFAGLLFIDAQGSCADGMREYIHSDFTICYPARMIFDASELPEFYVFAGNNERLIIQPDSDLAWPIHLCNLDRAVTVAGYEAIRTIFRKPQSSGCGDIEGFSTKILLPDQREFYIGIKRANEPYVAEDGYIAIEQSLIIR